MHIFSLWANLEDAEAALKEIAKDEVCADRYSVILHQNHIDADVGFPENNYKHGMPLGAMIGGGGGAILVGLAAGPLGLIGMGPLFAMLMGGFQGSFLGALGGLLVGSATANLNLERLCKAVEDEGKVLVSVNVHGLSCHADIESIFQRHEALEIHGPGWPE